MDRLVQVVPVPGVRLFGMMVKKELEIFRTRKDKAAFRRSGRKEHNRAKWSHERYKGWIKLQRAAGEVVTAEVKSLSKGDDQWQLLHAFIGWLDRHFADKIEAINIQYRSDE